MLIGQMLPNCALHSHRVVRDARGSLIALEAGREVPFKIERTYFLYGIEPGAERGFHAHRALQQWVVCVSGSCRILLDDGTTRAEVGLDTPERGLYIGPRVWREMRDFSDGAVLMVLASAHFDEADYIRTYEQFIQYVAGNIG